MPRTIKDADAAEYFGYVVMDNDSDRFEARARREAAKRRDKSVGIEDPFKRCTCNIRVAGDTISVEDCARHGVRSFVVGECCYCSGTCSCGWSKLDRKQLAVMAGV